MYTNCPNCSKEFEIFAEHLKAANGMVRCGSCQHAFNALVRLYDEPKQLDLPTLDTEVVDEEIVNQTDDLSIETSSAEARVESVDDVIEDNEDKTLTDIDDEITDNVDALELTIQDQITQAEFEDEEDASNSEELSPESGTHPALQINTENTEELVSIDIEHALQEVSDIPEPEGTIEDEITNSDFGLENTLDGIEEANIEEEITLDQQNVEEIRESVEQFKLLMGEEDEQKVDTGTDLQESEEFSLKNDIANIEGDVDPELQALTDLLDEVDDYIPEPEFKINASEAEQEKKEDTIEEPEAKDEPFKLKLDSDDIDTKKIEENEDEQKSLSVKAEEIEVINQAINRIQDDENEKIELPDMDDELSKPPEPLPELLEEQKASTNYGVLFFWTILTILIMLLGFMQFAWFNRDTLLEKYPQYYPQAKQLCEQINNKGWFECKIRRYKNLSAIQIKERDVRLHPEFEKTLLINASMVNKAKYSQDFPSIQIILFGDNGDQTAQVEITPNDYLDNSIDRKLGMQPDIPVHFIVEVNGEIESANSFEFHFF